MIYRQAMELGANIRTGEHGTTVVYADRSARKEMDNDWAETKRAIPFLKAHTVFNVQQLTTFPASNCRSLCRSRTSGS